MSLVVWSVETAGTTLILTSSILFRPFRAWLAGARAPLPSDPPERVMLGKVWPEKGTFLGQLVHCPQCLGFWVGAFWWFFSRPWPLGLGGYPVTLLGAGAAGSLISWFVYLAHKKLGGDDLLGNRPSAKQLPKPATED